MGVKMCICTRVYLHGGRWEGNTSVCGGGRGMSVWQLYTDGVCQGTCISALWATHSPSSFLLGFHTCKMETATVPISHEIDFPNIRSVLQGQSHKAQEEPCLGLTKVKTLTSYSLLRRCCRQRQGEASGLGPCSGYPISLQPDLSKAPQWGVSHQDNDSSSAINFCT